MRGKVVLDTYTNNHTSLYNTLKYGIFIIRYKKTLLHKSHSINISNEIEREGGGRERERKREIE